MVNPGEKRPAASQAAPLGNSSKNPRIASVSSVATASGGTPAAATMMTYGDDVLLENSPLNAEHFHDAEYYENHKTLITLGRLRTLRAEGNKSWELFVSRLKNPKRLTDILDQTSTLGYERMARQNYGFDEEMAHDLDVKALNERLCKIEKWHEDDRVRDKYLAPLLAIIQSSGTGKSRLMNCVRKEFRSDSSRTILLAEESFPKSKEFQIRKDFDAVYRVKKDDPRGQQRLHFDTFVREQCRLASENSDGSVRLFFDEAQHLLHHDGFLLRALRWITCEIDNGSDNYCKLTVVLAGTDPALANVFPETEQKASESRTLTLKGSHYEKGTVPFPPFFMLRTMGCLSLSSDTLKKGEAKSTNESMYESMIRYSRPLFAKLHKNKIFDESREYEAVKKVVLGQFLWRENKKSCLSVLGTRIQMGPTSAPIVSDLVSTGYAHLTYYEHGRVEGIPNRASSAFLPDPVCARIAMCLMDEKFKFKGAQSSRAKKELDIYGAKKTEMAHMMGSIFSQGVCLPAKGDYSEVATALYILFCGDELRKKKCALYKEFAVNFSQWMELVQNQGKSKGADNHYGGNQDDGKILSVNCIQFCRQDLRLKLTEMANETFLKGLYQKACAIYCRNNLDTIDLVVPCFAEQSDSFLPAAFSVKNYGYMSPGEATSFLHESWTKLNQAGIKKGICVLVIIGQDRNNSDISAESYREAAMKSMRSEDESFVQALQKSTSEIIDSLVACFVCIHDDNFGIDSALKLGSTLKDHQESEVFVNHSDFIQGSFSDIGISPGRDLSRFTGRYHKAAERLFTETVNLKQQNEG